MRNATGLGAILLLMLAGCGSYFMPDRNISDRIAEKDLVGTWVLTAESLKLLKRDGYQDAEQVQQIVFKDDGRCEYSGVEIYKPKLSYKSTQGSWKLKHDVKESGGTKANAIELPVAGELNLARKDGVLILWAFYGDPDSWEFMEYVKK